MGARPLIVALALCVLAACRGPVPQVQRVTAAPAPRPGATRVTIELENAGAGHGEAALDIELRGAGSALVVRTQRHVELSGHQHLTVAFDIPTPPGIYIATAHAKYPD